MSIGRRGSIGARVLVYLVLLAWAVITVFPLYWIFSTTFKSPEEARGIPPTLFPRSFSLENIGTIFLERTQRRALGARPYLNSTAIALGTAATTAALSFFAGFGFARYRFRGREALLLALLFINMFPLMARIIPLFRMFILYGLYDTYLGLILLNGVGNAPFSAWLMRGYIRTIPRDLEEAAMIDGYTRGQAVRKIIAPLAAPGLAAVAILAFRQAWNEFTAALILTRRDEIRPYTVSIFKYVGDHARVDWNLMAAAIFVSVIPIVLAFAFFQRYFVSGLTRGAIKS